MALAAPKRRPGRPKKSEQPTEPVRRRRGTGSVVVKGNRAYALAPRDADGRRLHFEGQGATLAERIAHAERALNAAIEKRERAAGRRAETVGQYLRRWHAQTYRHAPTSTYAARRAQLAHAERAIGDVLVPNLTPEDVNAVTDAMLERGLSIRYARQVRGVLRTAFGLLVPSWLPANPVGPYRRPMTVPKKRRQAVWNAEQAEAFLRVARRSRWGPLWTLAVLYGLRKGELQALRWADLDGRVLLVRANVRHDGSIGDTKAHTERTIRLAPSVVAELEAFRSSPHTTPTWMFSAGRKRGHINKVTVDDELARLVADAGVPTLTPHGLRHTAATLLLRRNVPIAKVSAILGHHNAGFTLNLYGWALPDDDDIVDAAVEGFLGGFPADERRNGSEPSE